VVVVVGAVVVVVVAGAVVVVVPDPRPVLDLVVVVREGCAAVTARLVEERDVSVVEDVLSEELLVVDVADADEDAKTVWSAASAKATVPSSDPPASQNVMARALRRPRRRPAPAERSGDGCMATPQSMNG
jgi:hypothetical protein